MITIKYFGAVAEAVRSGSEILHLDENTIAELRSILEQKYPPIKNLTYVFALNQTIAKEDSRINDDDEIALLPPFAGG